MQSTPYVANAVWEAPNKILPVSVSLTVTELT